jgi:hypothetical protein
MIMLGPGTGNTLGGDGIERGDYFMSNHDGTFENGYAWQYDGVQPPYYGAFAEGFVVDPPICTQATTYWFTQVGGYFGQTMDMYMWYDAGGIPGDVAWVLTGIDPGSPAFWPDISEHTIEYEPVAWYDTKVYIGYWGNWPGEATAWFVGVDQDGFGGDPWTYVAPGIGFPTGWQDPEIIWGQTTQAFGMGFWYDVGTSAVENVSWGAVKATYQ